MPKAGSVFARILKTEIVFLAGYTVGGIVVATLITLPKLAYSFVGLL